MNNYQRIMSKEDPLYQLNNTNYYLAFQLFTQNGHNLLDQNSNNYSKYFTINSSYTVIAHNHTFSNALNVNRCNSTLNELIHDSNNTMCIDFNDSN